MRMALEQRQTLQMVMTTELRQAIELLQLTNYDLKGFIEREAEENPFIELTEKFDYTTSVYQRGSYVASDEVVDPFDFISNEEPSLYDHLMNQVNMLHIHEEKRSILRFLVLNLDESGYLTMSPEEVGRLLNLSMVKVELARQLLLSLDPIGSGALDVAESLLVQAKETYPQDQLLHLAIEQELEQFAKRKWSEIAKRLHVTRQTVGELLEKIQTLQPKPAMNFSTKRTNYVTPDLIVEWDEKGKAFHVTLNNDYLPHIHFNDDYVQTLHQTPEVTDFVQAQYKKYNWLRQSIEQRRRTILRIMDVVLRRQRPFFEDGFRSLQPLTLQDVAKEIKMHESTVSRATANKIVETPRGTFELRQLFSTGIASSTGKVTSQTKIEQLLQEVVANEDEAKPLSDQKIAEELKASYKVSISRRTVAKYRQELNIPSSTQRKALLPT